MTDRSELLEAALEGYPEGIALLDQENHLVLWNQAAEAIAGYAGMDLLSRPVPEVLEPLFLDVTQPRPSESSEESKPARGAVIHFHHKLGHEIAVIARNLILRNEMGGRIGMAVLFHSSDSLSALPHGECGEGSVVETSQTEFEDRLGALFDDYLQGGECFGVLWITVDQAHELRKTHGASACDAMLEKVERAMAGGLRPAEEMGRWGDDEYLILSHERTLEMLSAHAQALANLARTADFRWWGDKVGITVSIGVAQAEKDKSLIDLLERAKAAMFLSFHAGGNRISNAPGGQECLPS
jgi:diguanylate cyclase (GGDEF)-like protein/PAS domain S-box-containing protein